MTAPTPQVLFAMDDASGTTVTNYGSGSGDGVVNLAAESTGFSWHPATGPWAGYIEFLQDQGANMAQIDATPAHTYSTTPADGYFAIAFNITEFDLDAGYAVILGGNEQNGSGAGFVVRIETATAGGNFDAVVRFETPEGGIVSRRYTTLAYSTDYQIVATVDTSTITSVDAKFKLNAGSVLAQDEASQSWNGYTYATSAGRINGSNEWDGGGAGDTYRGVKGFVYYYAQYRGTGGFLSDADMDAINADPTVLPGWPGVEASGSFVPSLPQRNRRHTGRYS